MKGPPPPSIHMKGEGRPYSIRANYSVNPQAITSVRTRGYPHNLIEKNYLGG